MMSMQSDDRGISKPEIFDVSGPLHLLTTSFNWSNTFHRRSVAACLVQGVYSLERDRQRAAINGDKQDAYAEPWWERLNFKLNHVLVDDTDLSFFGAIYELRSRPHHPCPPRYVIAFRGTVTTKPTLWEDIKLNVKTAFAKLENSSRFRKAFEDVRTTVENAGPGEVWLAGHSLGASMAMVVGRNMAEKRNLVETYLFNPPFHAVPLERTIKSKTVKRCVRVATSFVIAGIGRMMNNHDQAPEKEMFLVLSEWAPKVFVNPKDPICAEYIGYFEHRERMDEIGVGRYERTALKSIFRKLISGVPTVDLTENSSPSEDSMQPHGIIQWWQPHVQWKTKRYKFRSL